MIYQSLMMASQNIGRCLTGLLTKPVGGDQSALSYTYVHLIHPNNINIYVAGEGTTFGQNPTFSYYRYAINSSTGITTNNTLNPINPHDPEISRYANLSIPYIYGDMKTIDSLISSDGKFLYVLMCQNVNNSSYYIFTFEITFVGLTYKGTVFAGDTNGTGFSSKFGRMQIDKPNPYAPAQVYEKIYVLLINKIIILQRHVNLGTVTVLRQNFIDTYAYNLQGYIDIFISPDNSYMYAILNRESSQITLGDVIMAYKINSDGSLTRVYIFNRFSKSYNETPIGIASDWKKIKSGGGTEYCVYVNSIFRILFFTVSSSTGVATLVEQYYDNSGSNIEGHIQISPDGRTLSKTINPTSATSKLLVYERDINTGKLKNLPTVDINTRSMSNVQARTKENDIVHSASSEFMYIPNFQQPFLGNPNYYFYMTVYKRSTCFQCSFSHWTVNSGDPNGGLSSTNSDGVITGLSSGVVISATDTPLGFGFNYYPSLPTKAYITIYSTTTYGLPSSFFTVGEIIRISHELSYSYLGPVSVRGDYLVSAIIPISAPPPQSGFIFSPYKYELTCTN